ncbi:GumC family protein [Aureimonas frigidaquae]|uniref:Polysaccharide chain length determinant N-terminal domain-containing protein n=1 Tax=Aureimonas frigidaquae TaxID=424757 RepID=A0A0P0Z3A0_9HYPH|nr:hypothetical protein [Aureimonas frigidaquae]BAT28251.1 hypothetical protein [Aureimonas frigidaquae]
MDNEIIQNLKYYVELALRRPLVAIVPAVAVVLIGLFVVMQLPRSYTSEAIIEVRSNQGPNPLITSNVASERLQFIEQRVLARDNLLALVQRMNLFPELREGMSDSRLADLVRRQIAIIPVATEESQQYAGRSIFRVTFSYGDRELSAATASEIVNMIIRESRSSRTATAADTSQFLEREVAALNQRLEERDRTWQTFLEANGDALPSRVETLAVELNTREQDLAGVNRSIASLDDEIKLLEAQYRWQAPLADTAAAARQTQLQALRTELATKSSTMADAHPEIRGLKSRIENLEAQAAAADSGAASDPVAQNPELGLISERIELAKPRREALVQQRDEISSRIEWLRSTLARAPEVESQMSALERDRDGAQRSLEDMRAKLDAARIGLRLEEDNNSNQIQVVEAPEAPLYPSAPSRTKLMLLVLGLAAGVGAACLWLSDVLDRSIRGTFDLRRALEGQSVVVIPDLQPRGGKLMRRLGLVTPALFLALALLSHTGPSFGTANPAAPIAARVA